MMFFPALEGQLVKGLEYQIHGAKQEKVNPEEEGSQKNMNGKIPKGQVYAPRLEPTAPISLADRNNAHYPSRQYTIKDGSMTDFQHARFHPHGSHRKVFTRTLDTPNPWCG